MIDRGMNTEEGARTLDPWIHNPMLYQLSYLGIGDQSKHNILRYTNSAVGNISRGIARAKPNIS